MFEWFENPASGVLDDLAGHMRLRLLKAVDTDKYNITFLEWNPGKGNSVLLRASDTQLHVAPFTRSCFGLPVCKQEIRDDDSVFR